MTWMVRAKAIAFDGTRYPWERLFVSLPSIQMWDGGRTVIAEVDGSYSRIFRCVDWVESEQLDDAREESR